MAQTVNRTFTNNYPQKNIAQFNTEKTLITIAAFNQACQANRTEYPNPITDNQCSINSGQMKIAKYQTSVEFIN